jgi:3-phosphoshikimate 1-carboxyvinyltransferase
MLKYFGANIETTKLKNSKWKITLDGIPTLNPSDIDVPSDPSSASFPIVSAIITPNSKVKVMNVCINELRIGLYKTLIDMGANIRFNNTREINGELIADITAETSKLNGITVPKSRVASMIDEYPILAVAAIKAKGDTIMEGVEELRYKETDRIKAICEGLKKLGIETIDTRDSLVIKGKGSKTRVNGNVEIHSNLDHRIAMCFLCAGLISDNPIKVKGTDTINSSFPFFLDKMKEIGAKFQQS